MQQLDLRFNVCTTTFMGMLSTAEFISVTNASKQV